MINSFLGDVSMRVLRRLKTEENIKRISIFLLLISFALTYYMDSVKHEDYELKYEIINTKDMAMANVTEKANTSKDTKTNSIFQIYKQMKSGTYVEKESPQEVALPVRNSSTATLEVPKRVWYLPTEMGTITNYINASHFALDITSPRGTSEAIFPVANGVVSGIYRDRAGAKIVTVNHNINGQNYTSQYVHLSSYAPNLYIGKPVTINDYLGFMGRTGIATGVHLHLAVVDCSIFDPNDPNCSGLNGFFNYGSKRYYQGFRGLQSVMNVPASWSSR